MKRAAVDDPARIGSARDSVVKTITQDVTATLTREIDRLIFLALCVQFGGPYFAWADLRGRCSCLCRLGQPDQYLLDGRLILEIDHTAPPEPFDFLTREVNAGFTYRIVPRPE